MKNPGKRWEKIIWTEKNKSGVIGELIRSPLFFLSMAYLALIKTRMFFYNIGLLKTKKVDAKVIVVGNLSVGGTGKTPTAAWIAGQLADAGHSPVLICRGYKGSAQDETVVVSNGKKLLEGPQKAGDEPVMLAKSLLNKNVPVLADKKRARAAKKAISDFGATHIILDDGFQHLALKRDMNILVVDSRHDPEKSFLLPRGPLREPVSAAKRASAVIISRSKSDQVPSWPWLDRLENETPVFNMRYKVTGIRSIQEKKNKTDGPALAFCGTGDPDNFFNTVNALSISVTDKIAFPDHHNYTENEIKELVDKCEKSGGERLLTTEKDAVKIRPSWLSDFPLDVVGVEADFMGREKDVLNHILKCVDTDGRT